MGRHRSGRAWEGSTRKGRLPANWRTEIVPAVFAVWGDVCYWCGDGGADEVDHVVRGDDHHLDNLRPIHGWRTPQQCHARKSAAEGVAARAARPSERRPPEQHPGLR